MAVSATIIEQSSGSPLAGSPIFYKVESGEYDHPVFHRVKLQVVAGLQYGNYKTIEMSSPAGEGEELYFDISSALRAVADSYDYSANPPEAYPYIQYYLVAWDEYMINGVARESAKSYLPNNYQQVQFRALMGGYSDLERMLSYEGTRETNKFTRKPSTTPEVVRIGDKYIRPDNMQVNCLNITHGQQSVIYNITQEGMQTVGGAQIYAIPSTAKDCYAVRFINGLGCMESLTVRSLRQSSVSISTESSTRVVQETFDNMSRGLVRKWNDFETWKMSSGPVDEAWMSWYIHEFLMAKWIWINIGSIIHPMWIVCHVIPDETVAGVDQTANNKLEVQFTLQFDITGSLNMSVAV